MSGRTTAPPPSTRRTIAFFDGQNLFHAALRAFGRTYPDYDPARLAEAVCQQHGWSLVETRFYTGIPQPGDDAFWNQFWIAKLHHMSRSGVVTFSRPLRYQTETARLPDGRLVPTRVGHEKGIDVRIALDVVGLAHRGAYDVGLIFSQDQDLSEAADEIRVISREQERWIKLASAFPASPASRNTRGVDKTDWLPIDQATYERCLDLRDYRPKRR